ncbi:hypothetical protein Pla22_27780 [Rubripirellula amarantea]|uniref:DUF1573 domain-containing protein n=1 Tax=Rubripirellula amarantea TaxID=2527999 RepID=A0A5C5WVZ3_9BACT|nr:DUF1573 domain-containing protein [Rubripirellula amarantea]TWT55124.1 hypothetical protein Pla22_27780 [Rubripirellula amarantea]
MKKFPVILALTAIASAATGWAINHNRYGYRDTYFGPLDTNGKVTYANIEEHVLLSADSNQGVGELELEGDSRFDFGVMNPDTPGEHEFVIRNVGDGPLKLRLGATTCKCTLSNLDKDLLQPGETTQIKLTWTAKAGSTEFKQSAQLHTDDPKMPVLSLEIAGQVIKDFLVEPKVWTFGDIAAGEGFEISGEVFNFTQDKIEPTKMRFTNQEMTDLATFDVQEIPADELAEKQEAATQGFRVTAKVDKGMRQGVISQNLMFHFRKAATADNASDEQAKDDAAEDAAISDDLANEDLTNEEPGASETASDQTSGNESADDTGNEESQPSSLASAENESAKNDNAVMFVPIPARGRIVGAMSMIESSKLTGKSGGGYHYSFGKIRRGDSTIAKTFVVLKGKDRENTTLRVGETFPDGILKATLGEPKSRGSMVLYPLILELVPGTEPIERLGKNKDDYGKVWIESDNPKVTKMGIVVTFALDAK